MALNANNPLGLPEFKAGEPPAKQLTASRLNQICQAITSLYMGRINGFRVRSTPWGTMISPPRDLSITQLAPLQVYSVSDTSPKISVKPGTFGQNAEATTGASVPTISGSRIDTPDGSGNYPTLVLSSADKLVYIEVDVNSSGLITGVKVNSSTLSDPPASTPTALYVTLATINNSGGNMTITNNLSGSQSYQLCAGTNHLYRLV